MVDPPATEEDTMGDDGQMYLHFVREKLVKLPMAGIFGLTLHCPSQSEQDSILRCLFVQSKIIEGCLGVQMTLGTNKRQV